MEKDKGKLRRFTDRAKDHERGMWGVIDDEMETLVNHRQKARLAILVAVVALASALLTVISLFMK